MERLISPEEYTSEIVNAIANIKSRMDDTLVKYDEDTIIVFENDGIIYVLGNPILGSQRIVDDEGNVEVVPLYNLTVMYDSDWITYHQHKIKIKPPRLRIFRPDLCERINL